MNANSAFHHRSFIRSISAHTLQTTEEKFVRRLRSARRGRTAVTKTELSLLNSSLSARPPCSRARRHGDSGVNNTRKRRLTNLIKRRRPVQHCRGRRASSNRYHLAGSMRPDKKLCPATATVRVQYGDRADINLVAGPRRAAGGRHGRSCPSVVGVRRSPSPRLPSPSRPHSMYFAVHQSNSANLNGRARVRTSIEN